MRRRSGWYGESARHSLAARGMRSRYPRKSQRIGEKWDYPDARYRKKKVGGYTVELIYGTERGGMIRIWEKADEEDIERAERLPHIFHVSDGMSLVGTVPFMYWQNAVARYRRLKRADDVIALLREYM